jgi:hypothetical protein
LARGTFDHLFGAGERQSRTEGRRLLVEPSPGPHCPRKNTLSRLTLRGEGGMVRLVRHWRRIMMICILIPGGLLLALAMPRPLAQLSEANSIISEEPTQL